MSLCSIFSGENHHMLRQSSNHSSVEKTDFTYLGEKKKRKFNRILGNLTVVFVPCLPLPPFHETALLVSHCIKDHMDTVEKMIPILASGEQGPPPFICC